MGTEKWPLGLETCRSLVSSQELFGGAEDTADFMDWVWQRKGEGRLQE